MNHNHHRFHPFSWENNPGISKASSLIHDEEYILPSLKLPPPPGPAHSPKKEPRVGWPDIHVPLPPCPFQPPPRYSFSNKGLMRREGDPFLAAYMECTKSVKKEGGKKMKQLFGRLSCKQGTGVREDGVLVKVSQVASFVSGRDRLLERSKSHGGEGSANGKGHHRQKSLVL